MDLSEVDRIEKINTARGTPWRKLMLDAADYIEQHGLCQDGGMQTVNGEIFCTIGTLRYLSTGTAHGGFAGTTAEKAWHVLRPLVPGCVVSQWSDTTSPHEVVATLRRVATGGL